MFDLCPLLASTNGVRWRHCWTVAEEVAWSNTAHAVNSHYCTQEYILSEIYWSYNYRHTVLILANYFRRSCFHLKGRLFCLQICETTYFCHNQRTRGFGDNALYKSTFYLLTYFVL